MSFNYDNTNNNTNNNSKIQSLIDQMRLNSAATEKSNKYLYLLALTGKLRGGKKLSSGEMEYLRRERPDLYRKAINIERERKNLENKLRLCKSKSEVRALQASVVQPIAYDNPSTVSVDTNGSPDFAEGSMTYNALQDEWNSFINETKYRKMPEERKSHNRKKLCDKKI